MIIPKTNATNCFKDSLGLVSLSSSGKMVTMPMCKKPPAVKGNIQFVFAPKKKKKKQLKTLNIHVKLFLIVSKKAPLTNFATRKKYG